MARILPFIFCFLMFHSMGQKEIKVPEGYLSKTFTRDDELAYNHVLGIAQDQTGFLWIATWDGLSRYDGYDFRNYYHKPGDSTSLPYFVVNDVMADKLNNVWLFPYIKYNRRNDNFERFYIPGIQDSLRKGFLLSADKKVFWILIPSIRKWLKYEVEKKHFSSVRVTDEDGSDLNDFWNEFPDVKVDNKGDFWFLKWSPEYYGLMKAIWKNDSTILLKRIHPLKVDPVKSVIIRGYSDYSEFLQSESGTTWMFSRLGIHTLDTLSNQFKIYTGPIIPREFRGKPYCVWYDEDLNAHVVDPGKNRYVILPAAPGTFFQTVFVDSSHSIWYGTLNESRTNMGLTRLTETPAYFHHYLTGINEQGNLNPIFAITKDQDGDIWAGTRGIGYIYRIRADGRVIRISFSDLFPGREAPRARTIISDSTGIWIGCTENTIVHYDKKTRKSRKWILSLTDSTGMEKDMGIHNIVKAGNEIMISGSGIFRFNPVTGNVHQEFTYLPVNFAFSFIRDRNDGYLAGMISNTVIRLDSQFKETGRFKMDRDPSFVEHVCQGDSNDIWIALMNSGLGHIYPESGKTELLTTANGLSNNTAYSILKDKKGYLWISTNQGLSRFNPHTRHFRNFGKEEGLLIDEFNSDAWYQAPDGEMFFGGVGGLISFYPDSIDESGPPPEAAPLVITEFKVSGKVRTFDKAVYDLDSLALQKGDNNFQVTFACLNFAYAYKIEYRYRLAGADKEWTYTDHRNRQINYTNLAPGNYLLNIEATNPNGEWASHISLYIRIPFLYFQTWWFKMLVILLIVTLLWLLVSLYIRQIRLKAAQKQDELALESIRGQMNPHFIYNSLNSINYFILRNDKFHANQYIADFSRLIRSILSNMTEEYVPFEQELQSIRDYLKLEHLRFGDKFEYTMESQTEEMDDEMRIMPGMVQTFIENAIWHGIRNLEGRKGFIKVLFLQPKDKGYIRCCIEDTGVGRKLAAQYRNDLPGKKSRGIGIVVERLKLVNKLRGSDYRVFMEDLFPDNEETGTRVTIDIPVKV
jgi:streptogramin lyase